MKSTLKRNAIGEATRANNLRYTVTTIISHDHIHPPRSERENKMLHVPTILVYKDHTFLRFRARGFREAAVSLRGILNPVDPGVHPCPLYLPSTYSSFSLPPPTKTSESSQSLSPFRSLFAPLPFPSCPYVSHRTFPFPFAWLCSPRPPFAVHHLARLIIRS